MRYLEMRAKFENQIGFLFIRRFKSRKVYQAFCGNNDAMIKPQSIPKLLRVEGVKGFKHGLKEDFNLYKRRQHSGVIAFSLPARIN